MSLIHRALKKAEQERLRAQEGPAEPLAGALREAFSEPQGGTRGRGRLGGKGRLLVLAAGALVIFVGSFALSSGLLSNWRQAEVATVLAPAPPSEAAPEPAHSPSAPDEEPSPVAIPEATTPEPPPATPPPPDPDKLLAEAVELVRLGKLNFAAERLREALAVRPEFPEALNDLGFILALRGKAGGPEFGDAQASYRRALELRPLFPEALNNLGALLYRAGNYEAALDALGRAAEVNPRYPEAQLNLGVTFEALGNASEAYAAYRRFLELADGQERLVEAAAQVRGRLLQR